MEYVLLAILLVAALVIVVAVLFQKSDENGLSSALTGGSETYYGKDKSALGGRRLFKITLVAGIIFALAVLAVYVMQPDAANSRPGLSEWYTYTSYSDLFKGAHNH
jgi:preprotein translocase subunit SecG